ncbi:MAG: prolyl oligopeptidase family serine peptidase [Verrucomicrobiota bacterium]
MRKPPLIFVLGCLCLAVEAGFAEQSPERFEKEVKETLSLRYLLSLPYEYEESGEKEWPLVVFLHGAGERGDDLSKVKIHGPPKLVAEGESFPFILVSPQCPREEWWTEQPVLELIDHLEKTHRIDSSRIYLTGLSMGGYGTWHFACEAPERFAAIAPICGGGVPYKMRWIETLPIWVFHGDSDNAVPLEESERLVKVLQKRGNEEVKFTIYPETGHDSWTASYNNPELYSWLLSHTLEESSPN